MGGWNILQGSPLGLPGQQNWSRGWTADELAWLMRNPMQAAIVNAAGGPQAFLGATNAGKSPTSQWNFNLPSLQDVYGQNAVAPNYAAQANNWMFQPNQQLQPNTYPGAGWSVGKYPTTGPWQGGAAGQSGASTNAITSLVDEAAKPNQQVQRVDTGQGLTAAQGNEFGDLWDQYRGLITGGGSRGTDYGDAGLGGGGGGLQEWNDYINRLVSGGGGTYEPPDRGGGGGWTGGTSTGAGTATGGNATLQGLLDQLVNAYSGNLGTANQAPLVNQTLENFYGRTDPASMWRQVTTGLQGNPDVNAQIQQGLQGGSQFWPTMWGNLNYLNQYGLPGNQQLQQEQQQLGGLAGQLLGGQGQYGVSDLLSQVMQQGLPGQQTISNLVAPQAQLGQQLTGLAGQNAAGLSGQNVPGSAMTNSVQSQLANLLAGGGAYSPQQVGQGGGQIQNEVQNRLMAALGQGGLTPEFVQAQRELVLEPSRQGLMGQLNQMAGGQAELTSPQFQELLRRQERDFNNQLVTQGQQNYSNLLNQATGLGGQQFGQGLQAGNYLQSLLGQAAGLGGQQFGQAATAAQLQNQVGQGGLQNALAGFQGVAGSAYPYIGTAAGLGTDALSQSLARFATGGNLGLQNLQTIAGIGTQPLQYGMQQNYQQNAQSLQALNQLLGGAGSYLSGQNQYGLGMADIPAGLARAFLSGEQQKSIAQMQVDAANQASSNQLLGTGLGAAASLPWDKIIKAIRNL